MRQKAMPYPLTYTSPTTLKTHGVRDDRMHTLCGIPLSAKAPWGALNRVPGSVVVIADGELAAANPVTCAACWRSIHRLSAFTSVERAGR